MTITFNSTGFGLAMIVLLIIVLQLGLHKWTKKVTNTYWYWLVWGAFCLIWLFVFRFSGSIKEYIANKGHLDGTNYSDANVISRAFFLDMCPLMGLLLPLSCILDPSRKVCRCIAPIALIGGIMTIFIEMPFATGEVSSATPIWDLRWIFIGDKPNECYFFLHAVNVLLATGILRAVPKYNFRGWLGLFITACICYLYVLITSRALGCKWFVSGTNVNDWKPSSEYEPYGQYHVVAELLHCSPKVAMGIGIPFLYMVASVIVVLKDYVFSRWIWRYGNAYSGKWWAWYNYQRFVVQKIL